MLKIGPSTFLEDEDEQSDQWLFFRVFFYLNKRKVW